MDESSFLETLRRLAPHPAARGLADDAAVLDIGDARMVLTHDVLVEGVHFLPDDPPGGVAWKLLAVNLSDLAAKGGRPVGVLLGYPLGDDAWDRAFVTGLGAALAAFEVPLLGGDTVRGPRVLGLTAIGEARGAVPSRAGAAAGDRLWVSGTIGDAGAGLKGLRGELARSEALAERYRAPRPRLELGEALAPLVSAMMDVSDGLLVDAARMAAASGCGVTIELADLPLSEAYRARLGEDRLFAATAGDDYELLFTAPPEQAGAILALGLPVTRIGEVRAGRGLSLSQGGAPVPLPPSLGWQHGRPPAAVE